MVVQAAENTGDVSVVAQGIKAWKIKTNVWHIVILQTISAAGSHWGVWLVWNTIHRWHGSRILLLLNGSIELGSCRNVLRLDPGWLMRRPIRWCISNVVGPRLESVRVAPPSRLLPTIGFVTKGNRTCPRHASAVFVLCYEVSLDEEPAE